MAGFIGSLGGQRGGPFGRPGPLIPGGWGSGRFGGRGRSFGAPNPGRGPGRQRAPIPGAPHSTPPGAPPAPPGAPADGLTPLDSTYYSNVNTNAFNVGNKINALQLRDAIAGSNLQGALGTLAYQQPRAELALEQRANAGGGLYSSVYNQNLGNLNTGYQNRAAGLQGNYANQLATDAAQTQALQGSIPLFNSAQYAAAAGRASAAAAKNPASGEPGLSPQQQLAHAIVATQGPSKGLAKGLTGAPQRVPRGQFSRAPRRVAGFGYRGGF